ncbi:hypothetical protein [uncultured Nocardioides sp.]|uniref:hypothetical protein n=1 Tax=uncultured Nocardioides sp. TaxID=198441 RepID=UPI0026179DE9|nr:hypothetical protein [uncultured Nocardioides sp.]
MSSPVLGRTFAFDLEAPAKSRRAGLVRLLQAAPGVGLDVQRVWEVCELAWDPYADFDPRPHPSHGAVLAFADDTNGHAWSEYVLVDVASRREAFDAAVSGLVRKALRWPGFTDLCESDREDAAHHAILRVVTDLRDVPGKWAARGWDVPAVSQQTLRYCLLDALKERDRAAWVSLDDVMEHGERGMSRAVADSTQIDGAALEDAVWASAHAHLAATVDACVAAAKAGAPRDKAQLQLAAALDLLDRGACPGSAEFRHDFVVDPSAVAWTALRRVAPETYGRYGDAVPTRGAIVAVAEETARLGDPNAVWFAALDGRRQDVNSRSRGILHAVIDLVREQLRLAAEEEI